MVSPPAASHRRRSNEWGAAGAPLTGEPLRPSRLALGGAVAVILTLSTVALLWRPAPAPGGWVNSHGAALEYRQEARDLSAHGFALAPGWRWPATPRIAETVADGSPISYAVGYGAELADEYWFYSWASRALSLRLSSRARRDALTRLPRIRSTYYYHHALLPADRRSLDQEIAMALHGDLSRLRQDVRANLPPH